MRCRLTLIAALILLPWLAAGPARALELEPLEIAGRAGTHSFQVEVVTTPEEQARGLMFRKQLLPGRGMLFDFHSSREITMWMRNTYVPLDMIFIRADGRIHRIAENTEPLSERIIPSEGPVRAVLEVVAGTASKLGIAAGDRVAHPVFGTRP